MKETIFDGMPITTKQARDGMRNFLESVLSGYSIEEPKYETTMNQIATYMVRSIERS